MNLLKIKKLVEENRRTMVWLSGQIGMTNQNLYKCIEKNRIEAAALEKISNIFDVPITYFFNESIPDGNKITNTNSPNSGNNIQGNVSGSGHKISIDLNDCQKEIAHMKEMLKEKDNTIEAKDNTIDALQALVGLLKKQ